MQKSTGRSEPFARICSCVGLPSRHPQVLRGSRDHLRAVVVHDRVDVGEGRKHPFVAARKPRHEVRLDEAEHDAAVSFDPFPVQVHRMAVGRAAGKLEAGGLVRRVIDHAVAAQHAVAHHRPQFIDGVHPVRAGAVDDRDPAGGNVRQFLEQPRQQAVGRQRPGDVGDRDGQALSGEYALAQRTGGNRAAHGLAKRRRLVWQARDERRLDDAQAFRR